MGKTRKSKKTANEPFQPDNPLHVPLPPMPWQFSADLVRSDKPTRITRMFVDGWMMRMDTIADGVVTDIVISDPNECVTWQLLPKDKVCYPIPFPKSQCSLVETKSRPDPGQEWYWLHDGIEIIDERECDRLLGYIDGTCTRLIETCFIDRETTMRRRVATSAIICDWLNATVGPPDPAVFELPSDYKLQ